MTTQRAPGTGTRPGTSVDEEGYCARAVSAYYRWKVQCARETGVVQKEPSAGMTEVQTYQDKAYVIVQNTHEILAVYRVGNNGLLRRLRRWPKALAAAAGCAG